MLYEKLVLVLKKKKKKEVYTEHNKASRYFLQVKEQQLFHVSMANSTSRLRTTFNFPAFEKCTAKTCI